MLRSLAVAFVVSAGCTATIGDPSTEVFNSQALARYNLDDRAFVEGHAIGVLYFHQAVPSHTQGTGFTYTPGQSAPHAKVSYNWSQVVLASSTATSTASGSGSCNEGLGGCGTGSGGGSGSDSGGGSGSGSGDGACETFLNPAVEDAKTAISHLDLETVMGADYAGQTQQYAARFQAGVTEALASEDAADQDPGVEFGPVRDAAIADELCTHSPLVLDVDGTGIAASAVGDGVVFDLLGNGRAIRTAWPTRGALLVLDRDGDGRITNGGELFGNGNGAGDGFAALAELDSNRDGVIDVRDAAFAKLALWRDANRDGVSQPWELSSLAANGVHAIALDHDTSSERDAFGNPLHERGRFTRADGSTGDVVDVWFRYSVR